MWVILQNVNNNKLTKIFIYSQTSKESHIIIVDPSFKRKRGKYLYILLVHGLLKLAVAQLKQLLAQRGRSGGAHHGEGGISAGGRRVD